MDAFRAGDNTLLKTENEAWIQGVKYQGYNIIDIGLDPNYTRQGNFDPGEFYKMEIDNVFGNLD